METTYVVYNRIEYKEYPSTIDSVVINHTKEEEEERRRNLAKKSRGGGGAKNE